jgi:hypothetical protein
MKTKNKTPYEKLLRRYITSEYTSGIRFLKERRKELKSSKYAPLLTLGANGSLGLLDSNELVKTALKNESKIISGTGFKEITAAATKGITYIDGIIYATTSRNTYDGKEQLLLGGPYKGILINDPSLSKDFLFKRRGQTFTLSEKSTASIFFAIINKSKPLSYNMSKWTEEQHNMLRWITKENIRNSSYDEDGLPLPTPSFRELLKNIEVFRKANTKPSVRQQAKIRKQKEAVFGKKEIVEKKGVNPDPPNYYNEF